MTPERLSSVLANAFAFDLEGHKIQPGLLAPPVVCGSIAWWDAELGRSVGKLLDLDETREVFVALLTNPDAIIVGANIAFDMLCMANDAAQRGIDLMPLIFAAYEAGRVYDIQIAEALHAIAFGHLGKDPRTGLPLRDPVTNKLGRYSLAIVLWLVLSRKDAKANDAFRLSYALFEGVPISQWPPEAKTYPVDDACNTFDAMLGQIGLIPRWAQHEWSDDALACVHCGAVVTAGRDAAPCPPRAFASANLHNLAAQVYAAWSMHLGAAWGFAVDPEAIDALETRVTASRDAAKGTFLANGFLRMKKGKGGVIKPSKHTAVIKRATATAYGVTRPCETCAGTGKVESPKSGKPIGCRPCDSTGLDLNSAPVPRTKGSKCRTCAGAGMYSDKKTGAQIRCAVCIGQDPVIPGCGSGRDALSESGDDTLIEFAAMLEEEKILVVYLPFLKRGISDVPDEEDETEGDDE